MKMFHLLIVYFVIYIDVDKIARIMRHYLGPPISPTTPTTQFVAVFIGSMHWPWYHSRHCAHLLKLFQQKNTNFIYYQFFISLGSHLKRQVPKYLGFGVHSSDIYKYWKIYFVISKILQPFTCFIYFSIIVWSRR